MFSCWVSRVVLTGAVMHADTEPDVLRATVRHILAGTAYACTAVIALESLAGPIVL